MELSDQDATRRVAVVVAAHDAAATVSRAVASALAEPEVSEVVVVDDASSDDTAGAARAADDGSGRLTVHRMNVNGGPGRARNVGIAASAAPFVAVLDSDDVFVSGRLARLLAVSDWDLVADDIVFVASPEDAERAAAASRLCGTPAAARLGLADFLYGNVTRSGRDRRELGFLHVVMRRDFLERHGLAYDETLRLGEDLDLYARALAAGGRFRVAEGAGYIAVRRPSSLSAQHRTEDLGNLLLALDRLGAQYALAAPDRRALSTLRRDVAARYELRRFLDGKRRYGLARTALRTVRSPFATRAVVRGVIQDKLRLAVRLMRAIRPQAEAPHGLIEEIRQR